MNDTTDLLTVFFSKGFENEINEKMFIRNYKMDSDSVVSYVKCLIQNPLPLFIQYVIDSCPTSYITYQDIVQYSSISDATIGVCRVLSEVDNNGLSNIEVGRALLNDGRDRNDSALRKYGENHAKTAIELGLVNAYYSRYYLTCLGLIFTQLESFDQKELLRRTILRNRFFQKVVKKSQQGPVSLIKEISFLSESTAKRRLPNIRFLFSEILGNEPEDIQLLKNVSIYGSLL